MRGAIGVALLLVVGMLGCQETVENAPTTADYEAARKQALARARQGGGAPESGRADPASQAESEEKDGAEGQSGVRVAEYRYDPTGKRDPFRSFVIENAKARAEDEAGPLEQFDVSQLSVIATVWETDEPRALVADPSGRSYIVAEGAPIGKNEGRVVEIADGRVVIRETYVDWLGERTTKNVEMRLHREGKGG